jgi:hypothetical protein
MTFPTTKENEVVNILEDIARTVYAIYQYSTTLNSAFTTCGMIAGLA